MAAVNAALRGAVSLALLGALASSAARPSTAAGDANELITIAGSGAWGYADGPAASATFVLPTGLAYAPSGDLYIADQGAQRIRVLRAGVVSTVAGSGDALREDGTVSGGYADGPAAAARFDAPVSLAVDAAGAVLVVDRRNHCVRRIAAGRVDTYAGSPARTTAADGPKDRAAFALPTAIALDRSGLAYVADYGAGLRRIAADGSVTTLPLPASTAKTFVGLSAAGAPPNLALFATRDDGTMLRYEPANGSIVEFPATTLDGAHLAAWGVAALDATHAFVTDLAHDVVRLDRIAGNPALALPNPPPVAGTAFARGVAEAGFADGEPPDARLDLPDALAVRGARLAIADGAARRIREIALPDLRGPIDASDVRATPRAAAYRILFTADADAFFAATWPQSIPGRLERALETDRPKNGLAAPPLLAVTDLDALAATLGGPHAFDLIVVLLDPAAVSPATRALLRTVRTRAARSGTQLLAVLAQRGPCLDVSESPGLSATTPRGSCPADAIRRALDAEGIAVDSLDADLRAYEREPGRLPLFEATSTHFSLAGLAAVAPLLARHLEARRPWAGR